MSIAHLEIVSEDIVESHLERRYAGALNLSLLDFKQIFLSVTSDLPKVVKFIVDSACDDIALSYSCSRLRMHGLSEVFKKLRAVAHPAKKRVQSLHLTTAKLDDRSGLTQASAKLHDLARHDLACRSA